MMTAQAQAQRSGYTVVEPTTPPPFLEEQRTALREILRSWGRADPSRFSNYMGPSLLGLLAGYWMRCGHTQGLAGNSEERTMTSIEQSISAAEQQLDLLVEYILQHLPEMLALDPNYRAVRNMREGTE